MLTLIRANYNDPEHAKALTYLLSQYALDPMGGAKALPQSVLDQLPAKLARVPQAFTFLAFIEGQAVGLLTGFEGFSTFAAKPLLNIHDVAVLPPFRRQGVTRALFAKAEQLAVERGCCKITLEVLEGNLPAKQAYSQLGFKGYMLDPAMGQAQCMEKPLA